MRNNSNVDEVELMKLSRKIGVYKKFINLVNW